MEGSNKTIKIGNFRQKKATIKRWWHKSVEKALSPTMMFCKRGKQTQHQNSTTDHFLTTELTNTKKKEIIFIMYDGYSRN